MAEHAASLLDRNHFALRRVHSLFGIVPLGLFLINHMLANSTAFLGAEHFNHHIKLLHGLPWLPWIEFVFICLPLAFHGIYGLVIALQGRPNQTQYPYLDNWRYTLQRVTAYITIVFVVVHLFHYRFAHWFGLADSYAAAHANFLKFTIESFQGGLMGLPTSAWVVIYAVGLVAAIYHFSNGIVTFCITWGIVIGVESRQRLSIAAGAFGILLVVWGALSLYALGTIDPQSIS
ncbi:MAG: succinate dehydrogenase [Phycisphaerae bacterium]|nr:succinate dehydrogenase [Phycisphaerae bacterium]